jgi:heme-degrading monooxygenase HmoA
MFARNVTLHLKADKAADFTRTLENEVLPMLRKQAGFKDEITFLATEGNEVVAISLWDKKENAEAYSRETYPAVLRTLERVVEGTPEVDSYEVSNSTFHKIASQNSNQGQPVAR